ncbi:glycosyltransferase [Polynucleobacter sp. AP-Jannik-300A-C4]|uniref:glycosyltransferase n=1 Tax=Polynucleobacter sp. AP-Jannik-300A-C4 TaxID=2576928 RepID=UPI001BFCF2D4|nr:glycosyltransferase [Polynucleobacter sp. AP-Jannik-300A-C4]
MCAPICLFVYSRKSHTERTVEALLKNSLASQSDLIIFSDAARTSLEAQDVSAVRDYIENINGFKSIKIIYRESNYGLAKSICDGVSQALNEYESAIILEDDLVTSPYFLQYMNEALEFYSGNESVISIHGYVYPIYGLLPEAFFLKGADCWGWATWRRGWKIFNSNSDELLDGLNKAGLIYEFDYDGNYAFSKMLKNQAKGKNKSWAIRWHASAFLAGKLTLHPGRSLVRNIGHDASGIHCSSTDQFDVRLAETPIQFKGVKIEESPIARDLFINFFKKNRKKFISRVINNLIKRISKFRRLIY